MEEPYPVGPRGLLQVFPVKSHPLCLTALGKPSKVQDETSANQPGSPIAFTSSFLKAPGKTGAK